MNVRSLAPQRGFMNASPYSTLAAQERLLVFDDTARDLFDWPVATEEYQVKK